MFYPLKKDKICISSCRFHTKITCVAAVWNIFPRFFLHTCASVCVVLLLACRVVQTHNIPFTLHYTRCIRPRIQHSEQDWKQPPAKHGCLVEQIVSLCSSDLSTRAAVLPWFPLTSDQRLHSGGGWRWADLWRASRWPWWAWPQQTQNLHQSHTKPKNIFILLSNAVSI